ncbi:MAG: alpha/beta fold hydrolase [Candidatus Freyarchaeota archaeon]|nr:alpha/beta fold hydrolase [Candidatus Jordarchaeia archaeon]
MRRAVGLALTAVILIGLSCGVAAGVQASRIPSEQYWLPSLLLVTLQPVPQPAIRPIVFVHGGAGSAQQFESQAMRFTSNGYPPEYIRVFEYDSSFTVESFDAVLERLDAFINTVLEETGADKVDLVAHSLGTIVSLQYLAYAPHRLKVAHYVNVDGSGGQRAPKGIPTLAFWSNLTTMREMVGAVENIWVPSQTHTQLCTSAETFAKMYEFLTGRAPDTVDIVPETEIKVAGRVVIFPQNIYSDIDGTLRIWALDNETGHRVGDPIASFSITAPDGRWGPFDATPGTYYEFEIVREGRPIHHIYREPFIRSDYWVTLLTSAPGGISDMVNVSENHVMLLFMRNKEFWGDQGGKNDVLMINGTNIITPNHCPVSKLVCGIWVYDKDSDQVNDTETPIQAFHSLLFQTGVDLYIPASPEGAGVINITLVSRGSESVQTINVPNWPSNCSEHGGHRITVHFNDYVPSAGSSTKVHACAVQHDGSGDDARLQLVVLNTSSQYCTCVQDSQPLRRQHIS